MMIITVILMNTYLYIYIYIYISYTGRDPLAVSQMRLFWRTALRVRTRHSMNYYGQFSNQESLNLEFASSKFLNEGGGCS